jgi:hypothetical protein
MLTRNDLAIIFANHGDMYGETCDPADIDFELADLIIRERDEAVTLATLSDPHGYVTGFRRLIWPALFILIAIAVLWPNEGAH